MDGNYSRSLLVDETHPCVMDSAQARYASLQIVNGRLPLTARRANPPWLGARIGERNGGYNEAHVSVSDGGNARVRSRRL